MLMPRIEGNVLDLNALDFALSAQEVHCLLVVQLVAMH
jgi:hypothetical protein